MSANMNDKELMLDLLVDDELPESQRAGLLRSLDGEQWKELSIRFLQRQVERKSVKQLITAASVYPEDAAPKPLQFPKQSRPWWGTMGIAAGFLIAVGSAALTAVVLRNSDGTGSTPANPIVLNNKAEVVPVNLPGNVFGEKEPAKLTVPVLARWNGVFANSVLQADEPGTKHSLVIIRQDDENAIAVPVATTNVVWN